MERETMICPVCGGTIEVEHGTDGVCDTCDTRLVDGKIVDESKGYSSRCVGKPLVAARGQSRSLLRSKEMIRILNRVLSRQKFELVTIDKHGSSYLDEDTIFICPECTCGTSEVGNSMEYRLSQKDKLVVDTFIQTIRADEYRCHCKECGCKFTELRNVRRKVNWLGIIVVIVGILIIVGTICGLI